MFSRRLADISGPFFDPTLPFRNWSAFPYDQLDLARPPFVDRQRLEWGLARAITQLHALFAQGYTGIVIDNLAHLVDFAGPGEPIYPAESPRRIRAQIYRAAFTRLFDVAARLGMEVFVTSDMQWATPELRRAVGELRAANPLLRRLNRRAVAELFAHFPQLSGLVLRVGETGGAHNQGGEYTGHMLYTTPDTLRTLISDLLPICEEHGRLLIVRTWSVGIGELGDLILSPERYREAFGGLRSPHLLVSIKHGPADFFRLLPPNPTLGLPGPRQIVELQNRREYELFGLVPSSIAAMHAAALRRAAADPQCAGIWAWNSTGGWGGGQATLGATGWSLWTELSSALTAALAQNPELDSAGFVGEWLAGRLQHAECNMQNAECNMQHATCKMQDIREALDTQESAPDSSFILHPSSFCKAVADLYLDSAALIEDGWYMGRLPRGVERLGPVHLAPLLWVWWMRPTAALPIWAYLAGAAGEVARVLERGAAAQLRAEEHARRLAALAPALDEPPFDLAQDSSVLPPSYTRLWADSFFRADRRLPHYAAAESPLSRTRERGTGGEGAQRTPLLQSHPSFTIQTILTSAAYLADVLAVAQAIRALLLPLMAAADRGAAMPDLRQQLADARRAFDRHQARWGGRADFPPLELAEIRQFVERMARSPRRTWLEARAACAVVRRLQGGLGRGDRIGLAGAAGAASLGLALLIQRHRRAGLAGAAFGLLLAGPLRRPLIQAALPWLSRRLNLLPSIFFETGPAMGEWVGEA